MYRALTTYQSCLEGAIVASLKGAGFTASDILDPESGASLIDRLHEIDHGIAAACRRFAGLVTGAATAGRFLTTGILKPPGFSGR